MKRFAFVAVLTLVLSTMALHTPIAAQDATPIVPDPSLCTLTPPTFEQLSAYAASPAAEIAPPEATPSIALPAGEPVGEATRDAVEQSMIINVACQNSKVTLLEMSVFTDERLAQLVAGFGTLTQVGYSGLATPQPTAGSSDLVVLEFQDMVKLPDGRVAAIIVGDDRANDTETSGPTLFYLKEVNGHWYIDDFMNPNN